MSQKGNAGRDLIQVGRDYFRYLQVNIQAGNWVVVLVNFSLIFFVLGMVGLGAKTGVKEIQSRIQENASILPPITPYSPGLSPSSSPTPSSKASTESPQSPSHTSELKPKPEDIELNVAATLLGGSNFRAEGTVTNTSNIDIKEFSIKVIVSGIQVHDRENYNDPSPVCQSANGGKYVATINTVKNLKSGETRPVLFGFSFDDMNYHFPEDFPEGYKNSPDLAKCQDFTLHERLRFQFEAVDLN